MIDSRSPAARALGAPLGPDELSWLYSETRLWSAQTGEDLGVGSTLLLSGDPRHALAARIAGPHGEARSTTTRHGRTDWRRCTRWPDAVGASSGAIDAVVVHVPDDAAITPADMRRLMRALLVSNANNVFVVDADARRREAADGASGFVLGVDGATAQAAAMFAGMIHGGLHAPLNLMDIDVTDLQAASGTAREPACLVEAIWHRQHRRLAFFDPADERRVRSAGAVLVHPTLADFCLQELAALKRAVEAALAADCDWFSMTAPTYPFPAYEGSSRAAFVRLLCRPRPAEMR